MKSNSEELLTIFPIAFFPAILYMLQLSVNFTYLKNTAKNTSIAHFLLLELTIMKKLMQIIIFLSWISSLVWAGLELEKIEFFHSLYAMLELN